MKSRSGFTLVEILITITLILMIAVVGVSSVSNHMGLSLNSAARELGSTLREAFNTSLITGKVERMAFDLDNNEYWAEVGQVGSLLESKESQNRSEQRKKFANRDAVQSSSFKLDPSVTRKKKSLPRGVVLKDVLTQQSEDPIKEGIAYAHFFPHGWVEQFIVHLQDGGGRQSSLVIQPLDGTTAVYDRYIYAKEIFGH